MAMPCAVTFKDGLPLMYWRMLGKWEGRYQVFDPEEGTVKDDGTTGMIDHAAKGEHYAQRNTYTNDEDGTIEARHIFGRVRNGVLCMDSPRIKGEGLFIDDNTLVFNAVLKEGDAQFVETVRMLDNDRRTRTWHVYRGGQCTRVVHTKEKLITPEYTYFENDDQLELDFS